MPRPEVKEVGEGRKPGGQGSDGPVKESGPHSKVNGKLLKGFT